MLTKATEAAEAGAVPGTLDFSTNLSVLVIAIIIGVTVGDPA
jgi:hypothetical protein